MKNIVSIYGIHRDKLGETLFSRLADISEMSPRPLAVLSCEFESKDPRLAEILETLEISGYKKVDRSSDSFDSSAKVYWLSERVVWEQQNLDHADFFVLTSAGDRHMETYGRASASVPVQLIPETMNWGHDFVSVDHQGYIVSSRFRRVLESEGMAGFEFLPTVYAIHPNSGVETWAQAPGEPYWEIRPTVEMPPHSPRCRIVNRETGEPWDRQEQIDTSPSGKFEWIDGEFVAWSLHLLRSEVEALGPVDYAWSPGKGSPIISRRFNDLLDRFNVSKGIWPVFLDDSPEPGR